MKWRFATLVDMELERARQKHDDLRSHHEGYAVILEELEEFKAEVFKKRELRDQGKMLKELVQVAAMCRRLAEDLLIDGDMLDYTADLDCPSRRRATPPAATESGAA